MLVFDFYFLIMTSAKTINDESYLVDDGYQLMSQYQLLTYWDQLFFYMPSGATQ